MRRGLRIGRLFGINIHVDWSWIFIFILVTWNLNSVFGQSHPDWSAGLKWITAVVAAILFFGSVLAHELAHSLVARRQGVPVNNITLFLFGGVSNIQRDPDSPSKEFLMAIVGPLTSIVLGGVLMLAASATFAVPLGGMQAPTRLIAQLGPATTLLLWLGRYGPKLCKQLIHHHTGDDHPDHAGSIFSLCVRLDEIPGAPPAV